MSIKILNFFSFLLAYITLILFNTQYPLLSLVPLHWFTPDSHLLHLSPIIIVAIIVMLLLIIILSLDSKYEWKHVIFVFLNLVYLTQYDDFQVHSFSVNNIISSSLWLSNSPL
jgi:hypothetical protein